MQSEYAEKEFETYFVSSEKYFDFMNGCVFSQGTVTCGIIWKTEYLSSIQIPTIELKTYQWHHIKNAMPVRIANLSDKSMVIKKGVVLATCAPITCIDRKHQLTAAKSSETLQNELKRRIKWRWKGMLQLIIEFWLILLNTGRCW